MTRKSAYSLDLRQTALNLIESGKTQTAVASLLGVSRSSVVRWLKRPKLAASPRGGSQPRELGIDLQEFIETHPGKTLVQLALLLPIEKTALGVRLQKSGITFKKKITRIAKPTLRKKPSL